MDILSGSYAASGVKPMSGYFQVMWGEDGGVFGKPVPLKGSDDKPLVIETEIDEKRICTRPTAVDWDGDGDLDLVVGNFEGSFYVFKGEGKGVFANGGELLQHEGAEIRQVSAHSDPFCADMDGDGKMDLVSGSYKGGVQWAKNNAEKGISVTAFDWLVEAGNIPHVWDGVAPKGPSGSTRVYVDDLDGDGKLDLLVGDQVTVYSALEGKDSDKAKAVIDELNEVYVKYAEAYEKGEDFSELSKRYSELHSQKNTMVKSRRTGHVWFYKGK